MIGCVAVKVCLCVGPWVCWCKGVTMSDDHRWFHNFLANTSRCLISITTSHAQTFHIFAICKLVWLITFLFRKCASVSLFWCVNQRFIFVIRIPTTTKKATAAVQTTPEPCVKLYAVSKTVHDYIIFNIIF